MWQTEDNYENTWNEIEQPWKERIETNDAKVVLALDPNFTQEEIAQERMKILTSI